MRPSTTSPPWATCAASACWSASDLNVPLDGDGASPTTAASGPSLPTITAPRRRGRARRRVRPPRPARRARPTRSTRSRPVAERLGELLGRPVAFATDTVGDARAGRRRRRSADGDVAAAGEPALQRRARPARTTPSAARSPTSSPALGRRATSATASASCTASRPASTTSPQRLPHAAGGLVAAEVEVLQRLTDDPERPVRRGARRLEGLRQARRHRQPAAKVDRLLIGGGMVLHVPRGPGPRGRHEPARGRPGRHRARATSQRAEDAASRSCCRSTSWRPTAFAADAEPRGRRRRRDPGRPDGPRHRPGAARLLRRRARRRPDRLLERPDGRVRDGAVRRRHPGRRRGDRPRSTGFTVVGGGDSAAAVRAARLRRRPRSATSPPAAARSLEYLEGKDAARPRRPRKELT